MLRDLACAFSLAATMGVLYALGVSSSPLTFGFGSRTWDIVVLIGIMWMALGFLTGLFCSRFDGRLDDRMADIEESNRKFDEDARSKACRLNTYARVGKAGSDVLAEVIPFPRIRSSRRLDSDRAGRHAVS